MDEADELLSDEWEEALKTITESGGNDPCALNNSKLH